MQQWQTIVAVIGDISDMASAAIAVVLLIIGLRGRDTPPGDGPV